jgi:hypothetical protein
VNDCVCCGSIFRGTHDRRGGRDDTDGNGRIRVVIRSRVRETDETNPRFGAEAARTNPPGGVETARTNPGLPFWQPPQPRADEESRERTQACQYGIQGVGSIAGGVRAADETNPRGSGSQSRHRPDRSCRGPIRPARSAEAGDPLWTEECHRVTNMCQDRLRSTDSEGRMHETPRAQRL